MPTDDPAMLLSTATLGALAPHIAVPSYDRSMLEPNLVHIGVGGFHRSHLAVYLDELAAQGITDWGIVGAGLLPHDETMFRNLTSQDYLYSLVTRSQDSDSVQIIGSIIDFVFAAEDSSKLVTVIARPETQIVSLTITEGGYPVDGSTGTFNPDLETAGPASAFGILADALESRRENGHGGLTVMSCDNVISNGDVTKAATLGQARVLSNELADWIETNVSFPNSMVDRITPATSDVDRTWLAANHAIRDLTPVFTEPFRQWVIEDNFSTGRLPLELLDVMVTSNVAPYEEMKLRLLNSGHSCLTYLACLLSMETVDQAMADTQLRTFVESLLDQEAKPTVPVPSGVDLDDYIASLIERFSNPAIGDQISRLNLDGSAKFPKFLIPTIEDQLDADGPIRLGALALAGWCEYLNGTTESGDAINHSPDPGLGQAREHAARSQADPAAFVDYVDVLGPTLSTSDRFREAFVDALVELRNDGVRSAIESHLRKT